MRRRASIQFISRENKHEYAWTTSWGVSTRLVGTVVMAHGDDDGLILPPRIAPDQIVIIPITPKPEMRETVIPACEALAAELRKQTYAGEPVRVHVDKRDLGGGVKSWEWIKKGVPVRVEIGLRDLEKGSVAVARRDRGHKDKTFPATADFTSGIAALLQEIHDSLLDRATKLRDAHTVKIETKDEFIAFFTAKNADKPEIHGGFASAHWDGYGGDRGRDQGTAQGDHPLHPVRRASRGRQVRLERQAEHAARDFREELLSASQRSSPELRYKSGARHFAGFAAATFAFSSSRNVGE